MPSRFPFLLLPEQVPGQQDVELSSSRLKDEKVIGACSEIFRHMDCGPVQRPQNGSDSDVNVFVNQPVSVHRSIHQCAFELYGGENLLHIDTRVSPDQFLR